MGGGIQAGLSTIYHATRSNEITFSAIFSKQINDQLDLKIKMAFSHTIVADTRKKLNLATHAISFRNFEKICLPDVVFTVFGPPYWRARAPHISGFAIPSMIYQDFPGIKGSSLKSRWIKKIEHSVKFHLLKRLDGIITETQIVKDRLIKFSGINSKKLFVVPNSYSPDFFKSVSNENFKPPRIEEPYCFAVPSSYYVHKNLEIIPHVAKSLSMLTDMKFKFCFTLPSFDPPWKNICSIAEKLGVLHCIETSGAMPHDQIHTLYQKCCAVILPTLLECSTAVYPESFLAERALITSDLDFAHALCGDAAIYVNPNNHFDIAQALFSVISKPSLRDGLIQRGKIQLQKSYPSPSDKWKLQLEVLKNVVNFYKTPAIKDDL